jgi:endonuclease YncB( thermonuclease family)
MHMHSEASMSLFPLTYTPEHLALADRGTWVSATDGDTPTTQLPIRMLGIDAPEFHYLGADEDTPGKYDAALATFLVDAGRTLDAGLKEYLAPRLGNQASTRQIVAGKAAYEHFAMLARTRLDRGVDSQGKPRQPRRLFIMVAEEIFDRNGRLLAYINANYTKKERKEIPIAQRPTFNLQMMQDGHAVNLLIYPNVPKKSDLALVQNAVGTARQSLKNLWHDDNAVLLPYEFRWIIDTIVGERQGPDRFCGDITTGLLYPPQKYYLVQPEDRLFFFEQNVGDAYTMGFRFAVPT